MIFLPALSVVLLLHNLEFAECSVEISSEELAEYITEKQWIQPACILFYKTRKSDIKKFEAVENQLKSQHHGHLFLRVNITEITSDPSTPKNRHVRCYTKRCKPSLFHFSDGNLDKWVTSVVTSPNQINMIDSEDIEMLSKRNDVMVMLVLPTHRYFQELEELFLQILETSEDMEIDVHFVPPDTNIERLMIEKFIEELEAFPSVLIYYRGDKHQALRHIATLSGPYEVTEEMIRLHVLLHRVEKMHVAKGAFEMMMTNARYSRKSPVILAIYSPSSSTSYRFLHAFHRTVQAFRGDHLKVRFHLVDISKMENNHVLSRTIKVFSGWSIPFVLCIHVNSATGEIVQSVMPKLLTPTLHSMEMFLRNIGLIQEEVEPRVNHWSNMTCSSKGSSWCNIGDKPLNSPLQTSKKKKTKKKAKVKRKKNKFGDLDVIDDGSWDSLFTLSKQPSDVEMLKGKAKETSRLHLVIFTSKDCSYCKMVMSEFQALARSVQYIPGVSVFLMNCSNSVKKCSEYHVEGFPRLILFRVIRWNHDKCVPHELLMEPAMVDYHGDYLASDILNWLTQQKAPVVKYLAHSNDEPMHKDVRLVGLLYTKEFVQTYLHFSIRHRLLPVRCFLVLCELLYSRVECVGVAEDGNQFNMNSELFLSSVEFVRKDGAEATLFRLGRPMRTTLNEETIGNATMFHKPHKYMLESNEKCEDDHQKCIQVMLEFVHDHLRMPVTHVDIETFHSHHKGMNYMWEHPTLLSLVHPDNVTENSPFYQDLYELGINLYQKVNVAMVDVVEHSHWANLFVPRDYWTTLENDEDPSLLRFPRFCLIDLNDHNHAAFYPSLEDYKVGESPVWNRQRELERLQVFVEKYLTNRDSVVIETEHF